MSRLAEAARIPAALLGIALAVFAQTRLGGKPSLLPSILYACSIVVAVAALRGAGNGRFARAEAALPAETQGSMRLAWVLLALAVMAMAGGVYLFREYRTTPLGWSFHLLSIALLVLAIISISPPRCLFLPTLSRIGACLKARLPLIGILLLATVARFWQLGSFPFGDWFDEAENGLAALRIMSDPGFRPIYFDETKMPAQFNYLLALSFSFFGANPWAIRFVTALFGIISVLFAFLVFRRWFGIGTALVAAAILAFMRYDLTFSRFGMQGVSTPTFELAALYFLDRALAHRKPADFAWLGMTLGFGLEFYHAFRLFPVAVGTALVGLLVGYSARHGPHSALGHYVRDLWRHWLLALIALAIVIAPVAQYAIRNPGVFFGRMNSVSIFTTRDQPDLGKAVLSNVLKHLEMFNVQGDRNGRHNLPGNPMLDPVSGALFLLGLALAIWQFGNPLNFIALVLFTVMLLAGVFSLDFEAPQGLRSIGVIPALVYFITLPLAAVSDLVIQRLQYLRVPAGPWAALWRLRFGIWTSLVILFLGVISTLNLYTFFVKQQNDPSAWASYSTAETIAASEIVNHAAHDDIVLTAVFDRTPTLLFLAGNVTNIQRWTSTQPLPLIRYDHTRGAVMLFDETMLPTYYEAQRLYPGGKFTQWHAPAGGGPVLYEAVFTPDDLNAVQGIQAEYFSGDAASGEPVKRETLRRVSVDWSEEPPLPAPFMARLSGTLQVPQYGEYGFDLLGGSGASLWIDEYPIGRQRILLASGTHSLRIDIPGTAQRLELLWQPRGAREFQPVPASALFHFPVTSSGLLGSYYPTPDWTGKPAFMQVDPRIAFYFHIVPLHRPYSVEWTGALFAPVAGTYTLGLYSVDGSWLKLDKQPLIANPAGHTEIDSIVFLSQGWHAINILFQDHTGGTRIYLYWTPPDSTKPELVPSRYLSPPMGHLPLSP